MEASLFCVACLYWFYIQKKVFFPEAYSEPGRHAPSDVMGLRSWELSQTVTLSERLILKSNKCKKLNNPKEATVRERARDYQTLLFDATLATKMSTRP